MRTHPIAHGEQLGFGIDVEGDMLHYACSDRRCVPGCMRDSLDGLNFTNFGSLDEGDRGAVPQFDETVKGVFNPVHPIQGDEFHPAHLRAEINLLFDVLRANSEVMNTVRQAHKKPSLCKWISVKPFSILVSSQELWQHLISE